jgi:osmoprotectant transport system substrate-binding protein
MHPRRRRRRLPLVPLLAVALLLAACTAPPPAGSGAGGTKGPIKVGSKIDVEGPVLANIIVAMLEKNGFTVTDKTRTGTTDVVRKALLSGEIDCYPEYTANALLLFHKGAADPSVLKDAEKTYEAARSLDASDGVVWLKQAPANNTWGVAVPKSFSDDKGIKTFADWAAYINQSNGPVKVVGSQEFFASPAAMPAFVKAYGFTLKPNQLVTLATGDTSVTEKAAAQGTDGANAAMAYGTDPTIAALGLVFLTDDKGVQPYYQPAPTFRKAVIDKYPEIPGILDPVFAKLDAATLQGLNGQVAIDGKEPKAVATAWLTQQGFLK